LTGDFKNIISKMLIKEEEKRLGLDELMGLEVFTKMKISNK